MNVALEGIVVDEGSGEATAGRKRGRSDIASMAKSMNE